MPALPAVSPPVSFEQLFHDPIYLELKNHLYNFRLRRASILANVRHAALPLLEVGCGVSPITPSSGRIIYSDISLRAMQRVRTDAPEAKVLVAEAQRLALASGSVATIVCSEVLEHLPDDQLAIEEFARLLSPGGQLILTVPVHEYFFSRDDRLVGHYRRYDVPTLTGQLRGSGFENCKVETVAGLSDKIGMLAAAWIFRAMSTFPRKPETGGISSRFRFLLPAYIAMNRLYEWIAWIEARAVPGALATIVLIAAERGVRPEERASNA